MKVNDWLGQNTKTLEEAGIGTARLDCLVLLEDVTSKDRSWLLAHPDTELAEEQLALLNHHISRRIRHEPLSFIRGKTEFYGREFVVSKSVLEPRPESETMIDILKSLKPKSGTSILDVGTGSGALGITAKLELPDCHVELCDIDDAALEVALTNDEKHQTKLHIYKSDLLKQVVAKPGIILANLPYVPDDYKINQSALLEPSLAIFGGYDGLDLYRKLFSQSSTMHVEYVLSESLPFQHEELLAVAKKHGYTQTLAEDFVQLFRFSTD